MLNDSYLAIVVNVFENRFPFNISTGSIDDDDVSVLGIRKQTNVKVNSYTSTCLFVAIVGEMNLDGEGSRASRT